MEEEKIKKQVRDTFNSVNGMRKAEPGPYLFSKVMNEISSREHFPAAKRIYTGYAWKLAAAFIIAAIINIFVLINYSNSVSNTQANTTTQDINTFIKDYSLSNTTYLY